MTDAFTGIFGGLLAIACLVLIAVWVFFPFMVLARLGRQQKTLEAIERHTKSQAEFWRDRNVKIND